MPGINNNDNDFGLVEPGGDARMEGGKGIVKIN
jgi:hypothetical protein